MKGQKTQDWIQLKYLFEKLQNVRDKESSKVSSTLTIFIVGNDQNFLFFYYGHKTDSDL